MRSFLLGLSLYLKDSVGTMSWEKLANAEIDLTDRWELDVRGAVSGPVSATGWLCELGRGVPLGFTVFLRARQFLSVDLFSSKLGCASRLL